MTPRRPHLLSQLVPAAAEHDPAAIAVVAGDDRLSSAELAERVGRFSTALADLGTQAGDRVAIVAPKSIDTFVAMHGALHAGAIAVPIDPGSPSTTLQSLATELTPRVVVAAPATRNHWPDPSVPTIGGSNEPAAPHLSWADVAEFEPRSPVRRLGDDPAYIISTSGSTGRPKSIVHSHRSALRYAELAADCYDLGHDDRMANVAPFHFDQSTFELYAAPLVGAATVLVPEVLLRFPASVSELIERERVTTWYSVPTILRQLLQRGALDQRDLGSLRWVLFGGELFPADELAALMALLPDARFSNVYGPAEVNQCTFHHLDGPPADGSNVPIGAAWPDTDLRVVDADGSTLTGAARGELLVRTATAMSGYWNRPDLDDLVFVSETDDESGVARRWYRTGDVVDRDDDGQLMFVGRLDRQVKVRGVRIELEAIENALDGVEGVTASAAVLIDDSDTPLVGLVETSTIDDPATVLRALRTKLAPGAIPDRIVLVPSLPLTASGKVDKVGAASLLETSNET